MIIELCRCDGLPPHEHVLDYGPHNGVFYGKWTDDIARFAVDWKAAYRLAAKGTP